ncbi:uncharacterized protein LOC126285135 [Schistocerca gregaria]|uniref:uncharacterized protein LOC126285135 n=1 Tax=Schistocerca gregaria TaxID=7010 RepID=UPI00211EFCF1|nr:uncharacterized protein LOC126285135 [Schistocerca gregaria]
MPSPPVSYSASRGQCSRLNVSAASQELPPSGLQELLPARSRQPPTLPEQQPNLLLAPMQLVICVIDFLWESVVWNPANSQSFVNRGGPYQLLDVLENSIFPIQVIILGALTDLCEEGTCIPHLLTWRGGKGKKMVFQQLLAAIWRTEEDWIGVELDGQRCITDIPPESLLDYEVLAL